MQENRKKPVIMAETTRVMLWGFKITIKDERDGTLTDGYAIETGNKDYDIDEAVQVIKRKYARLGYTVTACEYDETRVYIFDALAEFKAAGKATKCQCCEYYIQYDGSVGQAAGCELTADGELEQDDFETWEKVVAAENDGGNDCPCFSISSHAKKEVEDKPDFLAEVMAALEELEEGAE